MIFGDTVLGEGEIEFGCWRVFKNLQIEILILKP